MKYEGRRITVKQDHIMDPSGKTHIRDVVIHPGAVSIIAWSKPGEIVLIRQYRYATGEELLELPAGTMEKGEDPITTAQRELEEETGYRAGRMKHQATYYTTPGFTNELMHLYEASDLKIGKQRLEEDEVIEIVLTPLDEAIQMAYNGKIKDAKTLVGLFLFK